MRKQCRGRFHQGELQKFGLDATIEKSHRLRATVSVDEPLAQVAWEFYVDVIVAHNIRMLGYERKDTILSVYLYIWVERFKIFYLVCM